MATPTQFNHLREIELQAGNGYTNEIIVMKEDPYNGDLYYILVNDLDEVDRDRIRFVLSRPTTRTQPLWDAMSTITLKNGCNALEYFHQLVKIRTVSGNILPITSGSRGVRITQTVAAKKTA